MKTSLLLLHLHTACQFSFFRQFFSLRLTRILCLFPLYCALFFLLASCETIDSDSPTTEFYEVQAESTPLFRLGPEQSSGPDLQLHQGTLVRFLKKSLGYSLIEMDNGWTGWVSSSDITPVTDLGPATGLGPEFDAIDLGPADNGFSDPLPTDDLTNNPAVTIEESAPSASASSTPVPEATPEPTPESTPEPTSASTPTPTPEPSPTAQPAFRY